MGAANGARDPHGTDAAAVSGSAPPTPPPNPPPPRRLKNEPFKQNETKKRRKGIKNPKPPPPAAPQGKPGWLWFCRVSCRRRGEFGGTGGGSDPPPALSPFPKPLGCTPLPVLSPLAAPPPPPQPPLLPARWELSAERRPLPALQYWKKVIKETQIATYFLKISAYSLTFPPPSPRSPPRLPARGCQGSSPSPKGSSLLWSMESLSLPSVSEAVSEAEGSGQARAGVTMTARRCSSSCSCFSCVPSMCWMA